MRRLAASLLAKLWASRLGKLLVLLLLLPYALAAVYIVVPPASTLMAWSWASGQGASRRWVPIEHISPALVATVITAEDSAFCSHWGVDTRQMIKSVEKAQARDKPVRATSTITQQVAKNLFLWQGRSWLRKGLELPLALWLELIWSKKRIAEVYLNVVEWGPGIFGAQAAALAHFKTTAGDISYWQAALLATSLPNPTLRDAGSPGPKQREMARQLQHRAQKATPDLSCLR